MSWRLSAVIMAALVVGVVVARLLQDPDTGTATWDASRASGFAGYLLLWASVASGLALHLRIRPGRSPLTGMLELHRITSVLGVAFVVAHALALLLDPVVTFAPVDAIVPFTSSYRPLQTGMGTLALWLAVAVLGTTAAAGTIPYSAWRWAHYLSFPCWGLALVHGITAGSDSGATAATLVYASTAGAIAAMGAIRMAGRGWASAAPSAGQPTAQ